jgi:hypothetical protein
MQLRGSTHRHELVSAYKCTHTPYTVNDSTSPYPPLMRSHVCAPSLSEAVCDVRYRMKSVLNYDRNGYGWMGERSIANGGVPYVRRYEERCESDEGRRVVEEWRGEETREGASADTKRVMNDRRGMEDAVTIASRGREGGRKSGRESERRGGESAEECSGAMRPG